MGFNSGNTELSGNGASEIRKWERMNQEKTGPIPADLFNLMAGIVDNGEPSIRAFHWLKGVTDIKEQSDKSVIIRADKLTADYLFQYLGFALSQYFHTDRIATVYKQAGKDVVKYFREPERKTGRVAPIHV